MNSDDFKKELRRLIAGDQLEQAADRLLTVAQGDEYGDYRTEVIQQSGQLENWKRQQRLGTENYADLARTRNRVSMAMLELVDNFPSAEELMTEPQPPAGVSEDQLKKRLFWLLVVTKLLVIGFTYLLWTTGGFSTEQFVAVAGIMLPVFAVFLALMIQDTTVTRSILQPGDRRVSRGYARTTYVLTAAYTIILFLALDSKMRGNLSFATLAGILALTEAGMGTYIGKFIFALFRGTR